jgi:adenosylhomocysteine nucleosidase
MTMTDGQGVRLGVLAGLISEQATLKLASRGLALVVALSGARPELAKAGADRLVAAGCTHLLSYGVAGGLADGLAAGDLLLPGEIVTPTGARLAVDQAWHKAALDLLGELKPDTGALAASDEAIASVAAKRSLAQRTGAVAVDMESHHIAQAAARAGLPFLVVRALADEAGQILPPAALVGVTPDGATNILAVLGSLARNPGQLGALMRLGRAAGAAHRTLERCDLLGGSFGFGLLHAGRADPL